MTVENSVQLPEIGAKVLVDKKHVGWVRAYVMCNLREKRSPHHGPQTYALVELDYGFYSKDGGTFISSITAHVENVKLYDPKV